nr:hypothetical protein [Tanacetum cinerariifolium]
MRKDLLSCSARAFLVFRHLSRLTCLYLENLVRSHHTSEKEWLWIRMAITAFRFGCLDWGEEEMFKGFAVEETRGCH